MTIAPEPTVSPVPVPDVSQMTDFPYMSASLSGIFGAVLLVIAGLAWRRSVNWLQKIMADVHVTREQATNSHGTNLRDDITCIDTKVDELAKQIRETNNAVYSIAQSQKLAQEDVRELRRDIRFAMEYTRDVDKRVANRTD